VTGYLTPYPTPATAGAPRSSRARAIVVVTLALGAAGVLVGGLWACTAPPIHAVVAVNHAGERVHDYLGNESENFFIAPFLMLGLLNTVAVVAAVLVWLWRAHRGPGMVVGLCLGLMGAATAAAGVGVLLVRLRYGVLDFNTVPIFSNADHGLTYVIEAPPVFFARAPLQVVATLLSPAAVAALVYAVIAAGTARDDLGAYPRAGQPSNMLAVAPDAPEAALS
jgi:Protein of unknown function (DUF2567)